MLVSDVITSALSRIGVIPIGGAIPAEWTTLAITELNDMLQHWAAINLLMPALTKNTHTLSSGTATYTIGASQTINVKRPTAIQAASVALNNVDTPCEVHPSLEEYTLKPYKAQTGRPTDLYYDPGVTSGTLSLYPTPDGAYVLTMHCLSGIAVVTLSGDTVPVPVEYDHAVKVIFAAHLASMYGKLDEFLVKEGLDAKASLMAKAAERYRATEPGTGRLLPPPQSQGA